MESEEHNTFDLNQFYDILMSISIKDKIKPLIKQFKKKNMPFIYQTIINLLQVLNSRKETPLMKFNALMATKLFFDTGEYVPVALIQIYLLPLIYQVATYRIQKRSQEGLTLYFIEKGYDSTKEMKRIGFNFVLLALEFTLMSAHVKPYRNLENQQLQQPSTYAKLAKLLYQKGVQPIQSYKFYIPSYVNQTRKRFLKKISKFVPDDYVDFFLKLTCDEINLNKKAELDLKKMISYGDAYYTIPLMNICEDQLSNMQTNFPNKKKYLNLLGEFMKGGDIYAVLIITRSTFLQSIYDKVQAVNGEIGFEAGDRIYPEVEAPKAEKRQFYIEFLKYIQIWAYCHPIDEDGEPTDARKIFDVLKTHRKFVFPPNILLSKIKAQMQTNLKINNPRNQKMIKLVDDLSSYQSRKKASMEMRQSQASKKSDKNRASMLNSYIEFDELEETVIKAKKNLDLICELQKLPVTIAALRKFKRYWQNMGQRNQIDADESDDIEIVIQQGSLACKLVDLVIPVYDLFQKKAISFDQYLDRVGLLMKNDEEEQIEASIQRDLDPEGMEVDEFSAVKQESQRDESESKIQKFQDSGSNSLGSKVKKSESQYQLQSKLNSQLSNRVKLENKTPFNDYQVQFSQPSIKQYIQQKSENSKLFEKKTSGVHRQYSQHSSLRSSRSSKSNRSSRKILIRQESRKNGSQISKKQDDYQQPQYKDILKSDRNNWDQIGNQNESRQSFISSEHSSVKQNKNSVSSSLKGKKQSYISSQEHLDVKVNNPSIEDYYGSHHDNKNSYVGFGSSSSSRVRAEPSKKSKIKSKESSIKRSRESELNSYNQDSFKIIAGSNESNPNKNSRSNKEKEESRFTFTSKEEKKNEQQAPSLLSKLEEDSIIDQPDLKPLLQSFHQGREEESEVIKPSKITTFKQCFDVNNQIISSKESNQKIFNITKGKVVNFIETIYTKSTPRNSSIVDMISQRNARQTIQEYRNERQKNRQLQTQSERVKSLESFNKNMRMKFMMKKQQQNQEKVQIRCADVNQSEPVSFYQSSECSMRKSETNLNFKAQSREIMVSQPQLSTTRIINSKIYLHYFPQSKSQKIRKCLLKSKSLLIKNEQFQIGYVTTKRQNSINITLFITPLKDNIQDVNLLLAHDQNVTVKLSANYIEQIKINMQESVNLIVAVENVPFVLPSLNFKFKKNKKYSHNQMLITIPSSFNKFVEFHKFAGQTPQPLLNPSSTQDKLCIEDFKFSSKMLSTEKIRESLNNFSLMEQEKHCNVYASEIYFKGKIFMMKLMVKTNGKMSIEGINMTGDYKNTKFLQFLMITFQNIFQSSKNK